MTDVRDVLTKAWEAVSSANLPEHLHAVAFMEAVRLLRPDAANELTTRGSHDRDKPSLPSQNRTNPRSGTSESQAPVAMLDENDFFDKLERETDVGRDQLEQILFLEQGAPRLSLPARRLGSSQKARQETVAQIISVARHYGLDELETSTRIVREECARLKCLDEKNINLYLANLTGIIYTGPPSAKVLRVRPAAVTAFRDAVNRLTGSVAD